MYEEYIFHKKINFINELFLSRYGNISFPQCEMHRLINQELSPLDTDSENDLFFPLVTACFEVQRFHCLSVCQNLKTLIGVVQFYKYFEVES
jgi:hypothetical protein